MLNNKIKKVVVAKLLIELTVIQTYYEVNVWIEILIRIPAIAAGDLFLISKTLNPHLSFLPNIAPPINY